MTLELRNICLRYAKKTVLENLSLFYTGGQLHALLGENGAGKSTAANIICGELVPDSGKLLLDGEPVAFNSPRAAIDHGICYVHQTPMLADSISIKENLLLGIKKEYRNNIEPVAKKWLPEIDLNTTVKKLSGGTRFFIALCSALIKCPKLLLLDEPGALLNDEQRAFLFNNLRTLANDGMNIIIITHNYDEAENWCDTVDFLEDGRLVQKKQLEKITLETTGAAKTENGQGLELPDLNIKLQKGKITLIQALAQEGLDELEKEITDLVVKRDSRVKPGNDKCSLPGNDKLSFYRQQCALIPTDRKYKGSNPNLTVLQMLTAALDIPLKQKPDAALKMITAAGVNITPQEKCRNLSGGMLQKLLFERELYNNPKLLILCNPLQGLDAATCSRTCTRIRQAADNGAYVLVLSYGAFPSEFSDVYYKGIPKEAL